MCSEESFVEDELDLDSKASIAALSDHDYTPPAKRGRFSLLPTNDDINYCSASPPLYPNDSKNGKFDSNEDLWTDGGGSGDEPTPEGDPPSPDLLDMIEQKVELDLPPIKSDPDLAEAFSQDAIDSMMSRLQSNHNWTEPNAEKGLLDTLAQSLIVELSATAGKKHFREDTELE